MQAEKILLFLQFQGDQIPRKLVVNQKINQIIDLAKLLFDCPDEGQEYCLFINQQEIEQERLLSELNLEAETVLELVEKPSPSAESPITFTIINRPNKAINWQGFQSRPISEALQAYYQSNGLIASSFDIFVDRKWYSENTILGTIPDIQEDAVVTLVPKTERLKNQIVKEEEKIEEKEINFLLNGNQSLKLPVNWKAPPKVLKQILSKTVSLPKESFQMWSVDGKELDEDQQLCSQLDDDHSIIEIELLEYITLEITSSGQQSELAIPVYPHYDIKGLKTKFEKEIKISSCNQIWRCDEFDKDLENDAKLSAYIKDQKERKLIIYVTNSLDTLSSRSKIKSQEKEMFLLQYNGNDYRKMFSVDEDISVVKQTMMKPLKILDENQLILKFRNEIMDSNRCLSDYMSKPTEPIKIEIAVNQQDLTKVFLSYQEKKLKLEVKKGSSIKELRDLACSKLNMDTSFLYSLFLDNERLESFEKLQDVKDFEEENSVLELTSKVKISFVLAASNMAEKSELKHHIFDPTQTVQELKKEILTLKFTRGEEFDLILAGKQLNELSPLSTYLSDEDSIIEIHEKEEKASEIEIVLNKLPENKKLRISISRSERFQNLAEIINREWQIDSLTQVWRCNDKHIMTASVWEAFIASYGEKEGLVIDVFECMRPFEQKVNLIRHQSNESKSEVLKMNLLITVEKLKQEVAQKLNLAKNCTQIWKFQSIELSDDLPLAVQYSPLEKEDLHIHIPNQKELTFVVGGNFLTVFVDLDTPILNLKEALFKENQIKISPKKQSWSLENDNSQILEDNQSLYAFLKDCHKNKIWVQEKSFLMKLKFVDIEAQVEKTLDFNIDPTQSVDTLKEIAKQELNIDPSKQCWMMDEIELINSHYLSDYIPKDKNIIHIEVFKFAEFIIVDGDKRFPLSSPLNLRVADFKQKIEGQYNAIDAEMISLISYETKLENEKKLQDYFNLWVQFGRPIIQIKKASKLLIQFLEKTEAFYFNYDMVAATMRKEISEKFALQNHEFLLKDGDKEVLDKDLKEILQKEANKVLVCFKLKKIVIDFEDLGEKSDKVYTVNAHTPLKLLVTKAAKKLNIPIEECFIVYKGRNYSQDVEKLLDELDPEFDTIKMAGQSVKQLEVKNGGSVYTVDFLPSETVEKVKERLMSAGFNDIEKFSLRFKQDLLQDNKTLESYKIKYGKQILDTVPNKEIFVSINGEEFPYALGGSIKSVGQLKQKIQNSHKIALNKQILIFTKSGQWQRILDQDGEGLVEIANSNEGQIVIICKLIKQFSIKIGNQGKTEVFNGVSDSGFEEQKKILEFIHKIPAEQQVWTVEKDEKMKEIDKEQYLENFGDTSNTQLVPVHIFRKIDLSVCLSIMSHKLENVSTYETIRIQKEKIHKLVSIMPDSQSWFYDEKELDDDRQLEDYFCVKKDGELNDSSYALDLIVKEDLEYFGFTEKNEINIELFKQFFIESDESLDLIIKSIHFNKKEDALQFRNKLLGLFFSTLKKHSLWENLIKKIKKRTYDLKEFKLWEKPQSGKNQKSQFNTQFLLYYFLNSGTSELNVEILRIMKLHFPVPLAINTWSNRFSIEGTKILDDLYWVIQKGFYITSYGFGGAENQACGKTELNNRFLNSNFVKNDERNEICKGCPEISFDIYRNDKFPINFIDIPSAANEEIRNKIISASNLLIIHSLTDEETTKKHIQEKHDGLPVIVIYRDQKNAFSNISSFRKNLSEAYSKALSTCTFEVKITKIEDYLESNELNDVSEKVNEYILTSFQQLNDDKQLWRFLEFYENHNKSFPIAFDKIRDNSSQVIEAIPVFNKLKNLDRVNKMSHDEKEKEAKRLRQEFEKKSLSPEMNEILEIICASESSSKNQSMENPCLILEKLQEYLRTMKNQQTIDFYKLYEYKSKLSEGSTEDKKVLDDFHKYWELVRVQDNCFKDKKPSSLEKEVVYKFIETCIATFEQVMIPSIFSIELFWRELIYFNTMKPGHRVTRKQYHSKHSPKKKNESAFSLDDFLVSLKKGNLLNSYPFEIIDGDLLYMPKEFFKTIFKGMGDRVVVISVLGPQSSGKSTLLNFLFGCNFVTSSGRCTKGVYGTYFKVSNNNSCDGILVLDTEGLFGLLNKEEEQNRDKFDKKLVLFCLAMSDFVFINFKGDIDRTLTEVLMVCKESLRRLQQGNIQIPEMFLILNQNTQTNINTQLQDIDKMGDLGFSRANVEVLPLAFDTSTTESQAVQKFMDPVMKKIPKKDFSEKCNLLTRKLFDKISKNIDSKRQRTLEAIIDRMEHLWELLDKFPDLLKYNKLQDQSKDLNIKQWIEEEVDMKLTKEISKIVDALKKSPKMKLGWEKEFNDLYSEEVRMLKKRFYDLFEKNTEEYLFKELEGVLFAHIDRMKVQKINELKLKSHQEQIKIYDISGNEIIREAACRAKAQQSIAQEEKDKYFEEAWNIVLKNLRDLFNRERESQTLFRTVVDHYRVNINKFTAALPILEYPKDMTLLLISKCKEKLKSNIQKEYVLDRAFENTNQPPALIFKPGKTNVSGKYFNLRKYFTEEEVEESFGIRKNKLHEIFDFDRIRREALEDTDSKTKEEVAHTAIVNDLYTELSACGVEVSRSLLSRHLKYKVGGWLENAWMSSNYVSPEEFKKPDCFISSISKNQVAGFNYIHSSTILEKKKEFFQKTITFKCFFEQLFKNLIYWYSMKKSVKLQLEIIYKEVQAGQLNDKINRELAKINLRLDTSSPFLNSIWFRESDEIQHEISNIILPNYSSVNLSASSNNLHDSLNRLNFIYLKKENITKNMQRVLSADNQSIVIQRFRGKRRVVQKTYGNISWLDHYAKEDSSKIFSNTIMNKPLLGLVFNEFDFNGLIDNIFGICVSNVEKNDDWNSAQLYQNIVRDINDCIGMANNDLQQVSYRLDYKLVGSIHATMVNLIWKLFEENYWMKITQPIKDMEARKEQQKDFFNSITSSDLRKSNTAEAGKIKQYLEGYITTSMIPEKKKKVLHSSSERFKNETKRKQLQERIDAKYFSRNASSDNDDLYKYVFHPHEVLNQTYKEISTAYTEEISSQLQQINLDSNKAIQEILQRLTSIQVLLSTLPEESWSLDNIFEFKEYNLVKTKEIGMNAYSSQLGEILYKTLLKIIRGTFQKEHTKHQIDSHVEVIAKTIDVLEIPFPDNSDVSEIIDYLEIQSGRVTNMKFFVESLVEQLNLFMVESKGLFQFTDEDKKDFEEQINIFVCKERCPCCERVCGEEDPHHSVHRCLYGHQIRAIGGTMLDNNEASIARCEDIEDFDKMLFNGIEMTWAEFKIKMRNAPNNPWSFDDISQTRQDPSLTEKFKFAWTLIGKRICSENYPSMKYVPFNQTTIDNQRLSASKPTTYIYMIDSSGMNPIYF